MATAATCIHTVEPGAAGPLRRFWRARMTTRPNENPTNMPALVVFGRDEAGKAHASSFAQGEAKLAERAAGLMGLRLLPVITEAEQALAAKVPRGRVFASGKAFVPFV